jgi:hypothetical protein
MHRLESSVFSPAAVPGGARGVCCPAAEQAAAARPSAAIAAARGALVVRGGNDDTWVWAVGGRCGGAPRRGEADARG